MSRVAVLVEVEAGVHVPADLILDEGGRLCEVGIRDVNGEWTVMSIADPNNFGTLSSVVEAAGRVYRNEPRRFARREEESVAP